MPMEDILSGSSVIERINGAEPLTTEQKWMISELFDNLDVAHDHMARPCGMLGILSQSLNSIQLLLLLQASVRPMIQVNAMHGFLDEPSTSQRKMDLPESKPECIKMLMIPRP